MTTEKDLQEVIEKEDAHHRVFCAVKDLDYEGPAERKNREAFVAAVARGRLVHDALALFFPDGRAPESTAPTKRPTTPRPEVTLTEAHYQALARACER
jgi:hypothetical protein